MEFIPLILSALSVIFAGGGLWAYLAAKASAKAANQTASTADWSAFMTFLQTELSSVRDSATKLEVRVIFLEQQREEDLAHIDALENHIWQQLPPPPPLRRRRTKPTPEEAP